MMYLVIIKGFYDTRNINRFTRYFDNLDSAIAYCYQLNEQLAKYEECEIEELGEWYEVVEIKKGI